MFRSFAVANYRLWFAGALVSNIGTWMQRIAQDWIVLTQLTNGDATAVGITTALQFGPQLLLLPLTGLVADRFDRRHVLMITQATMGLLGLGLGLITVFQVRRTLDGVRLRARTRGRGGLRRPRPPGVRRRARATPPAGQRRGAQLGLLQRRPTHRTRRCGPADGSGRGWMGVPHQRGHLRGRPGGAGAAPPLRVPGDSQAAPRARADPRGVPLRAQATRHPAGLRHDLPHRNVRVQLPDLHLDDVARVRARRERIRRALVGARHRLALWAPSSPLAATGLDFAR